MNKAKRLKVYERYNGHCAYCGKKIDYKDMQVDHIQPKHSYRTFEKDIADHINNLNPSCRRCNHYKRGADIKAFRRLLLTLHQRVRKQYINKVAEDYGIITVKPWDGLFYFEKAKLHDNPELLEA
jgi:5-methylcytosine-specific restriction endonuclease McrA